MHALCPCIVLLNVLKATIPAGKCIHFQVEDVFSECRAGLRAHLQLQSMHYCMLQSQGLTLYAGTIWAACKKEPRCSISTGTCLSQSPKWSRVYTLYACIHLKSWQMYAILMGAGSAGGASKRAVLKLLQQEPLQSVTSVIVYCTFQSQADEIAQFLYSQGVGALSYHAGKTFKVYYTSQHLMS